MRLTAYQPNDRVLGLRCGELVEVRSEAEIRATLDGDGALDGLPFMPEMRRFCGRTLRVARRADRFCVEGADSQRAMRDAVFLEEVRCDGSAHGGCQRGCLIFWKEAWLKRGRAPIVLGDRAPEAPRHAAQPGERFSCQSTALLRASAPLPWWDVRQYARDLASGNLGARDLAAAFVATARDRLRRVLPWPRPRPAAPPPAAATRLDLRPGERVEVRTLAEIEATLDGRRKLRGLEFAPGMEAHCGRTYRVLKRVDRIVLETTGEVRTLKDTVVLDGVNCDGLCERGCPRANQLYWREAWLKRVEDELTNR